MTHSLFNKTTFWAGVASIALVIAFLIPAIVELGYCIWNPQKGFEHTTGRPLPKGVKAINFAWSINDNFFHIGKYWLLSGTPETLKQVVIDTRFTGSTEDAKWMLPDTKSLFDLSIPSENIVAGFEDDAPRNNWYWIFAGEALAIYNAN